MTSLRNGLFAAPHVTDDQREATAAANMGSLRKGWESGRLGAEINPLASSISSLRAQAEAGDANAAAEADRIGQQMAALQQRQAMYAPEVGKVENVDGVGSALSWAGSQVGQGVASSIDPLAISAAGSAAGRVAGMLPGKYGKIGKFLGNAAGLGGAFAVNQDQLKGEFYNDASQDKELMARTSATELNDTANMYGAGAGALDTVFPWMVGRGLTGAGLRKGISGMGIGAKTVGGMLLEGTTELAQDVASKETQGYLNPNRNTSGDKSSYLNSFAGGAVGSGPMSAGGAMADAGYRRVGHTSDIIGAKAGDMYDLASGAVGDALNGAKQKINDSGVIGKAQEAFETAKQKYEESDLGEQAQAAFAQAKQTYDESGTAEKVKGAVDQSMKKAKGWIGGGKKAVIDLMDDARDDDGKVNLGRAANNVADAAEVRAREFLGDSGGIKLDPQERSAIEFDGLGAPQEILAHPDPDYQDAWFAKQDGMREVAVITRLQTMRKAEGADPTINDIFDRIAAGGPESAMALDEGAKYILDRAESDEVISKAAARGSLLADVGAKVAGLAGKSVVKAGRAAVEFGQNVAEGAKREYRKKNAQGEDAMSDDYASWQERTKFRSGPTRGQSMEKDILDGEVNRRAELYGDILATEARLAAERGSPADKKAAPLTSGWMREIAFELDATALEWGAAAKKAWGMGNAQKSAEGTKDVKTMNVRLDSLAHNIRMLFKGDAERIVDQLRAVSEPDVAPLLDRISEQIAAGRTPAGRKARADMRMTAANDIIGMLPQDQVRRMAANAIPGKDFRLQFLELMEGVANGHAHPAMQAALEKELGADVMRGIYQTMNGDSDLEGTNESDGFGDGENSSVNGEAGFNDETGEYSDGEALSAYDEAAAQKNNLRGTGARVYGGAKAPTLRGGNARHNPFDPLTKMTAAQKLERTRENQQRVSDGLDPIAEDESADRMRLFPLGEGAVPPKNYEPDAKDSQGMRELKLRMVAMEEEMNGGKEGSAYDIRAHTASKAMDDLNLQPAKRLALYRDYLLQDSNSAQGKKDAAGARELSKQADSVRQALAHMMRPDDTPERYRAGADAVLKQIQAEGKKYFDERYIVVGEGVGDRIPDKLQPAEIMDMTRDAASRVHKIKGAALKEAEAVGELRDSPKYNAAYNRMLSEGDFLVFKSRDGKKDVPIQAWKLVAWARAQSDTYEGKVKDDDSKNADGKYVSFSNKDKDAEFLSHLWNGINATLASGHVKKPEYLKDANGDEILDEKGKPIVDPDSLAGVMPYKVNERGVQERFEVTKDNPTGIPPSLTLTTMTQGDREFGRKQRVDKVSPTPHEDPLHGPVRPLRNARSERTKRGRSVVRDARAEEDHQDEMKAEQVEREYYVADPYEGVEDGKTTIQRRRFLLREESDALRARPSSESRDKRLERMADLEGGYAGAEVRDAAKQGGDALFNLLTPEESDMFGVERGKPVGGMILDLIADRRTKEAKDEFNRGVAVYGTNPTGGKSTPQFNVSADESKTDSLAHTPLDFVGANKTGEAKDEFSDQQFNSKVGGEHSTAGIKFEPPVSAKRDAKKNAGPIERALLGFDGPTGPAEGLNMIVARIKAGVAPKWSKDPNVAVGGPHLLYAAAAALRPESVGRFDSGEIAAEPLSHHLDYLSGHIAMALRVSDASASVKMGVMSWLLPEAKSKEINKLNVDLHIDKYIDDTGAGPISDLEYFKLPDVAPAERDVSKKPVVPDQTPRGAKSARAPLGADSSPVQRGRVTDLTGEITKADKMAGARARRLERMAAATEGPPLESYDRGNPENSSAAPTTPKSKARRVSATGEPITRNAIGKAADAKAAEAAATVGTAQAPVVTGALGDKLSAYLEELNNPGDDFTTKRADAIGAFAERQIARLDKAIVGLDETSDQFNSLYDARMTAVMVQKKATEVAGADRELAAALGQTDVDVGQPPAPAKPTGPIAAQSAPVAPKPANAIGAAAAAKAAAQRPQVRLEGRAPNLADEQARMNEASAFVSAGSPNSFQTGYMAQAAAAGMPVNPGKFTASDVVYVSAETMSRASRVAPPIEQMEAAVTAGATILTQPPGKRNTDLAGGVNEITDWLTVNGYVEGQRDPNGAGKFGWWRPAGDGTNGNTAAPGVAAGAPKSQSGQRGAVEAQRSVRDMPMNYRDGSNGLAMRPEFRGKSTMDLIRSGDRTATTGTFSRFAGLKVGDIFTVVGADGERIAVRMTALPQRVADITAEEWSRREGWAPSGYAKNVNRFQARYELAGAAGRKLNAQVAVDMMSSREIMRNLGFRAAPEKFSDIAAKLIVDPKTDLDTFIAQSSEALSHMLMDGDSGAQIRAALGNDAWGRERSRIADRLIREKGLDRGDALVASYREVTRQVLAQELMARSASEKSFVARIKKMVQDFVSRFKEVAESAQFEDLVRNSLNAYLAKATGPIDLKANYTKVTFQQAVDGDPQAARVLAHMAKNPNVAITGSIVLADSGTIYRDAANMLHDLDFIVSGTKADAEAYMREAFPDAVQVYDFKTSNGKVDSYLVPPNGATIENIVKENGTKGKVVSFDVMKGGKVIGRTWNDKNGEHKKGDAGTFVDFFTDTTQKPVKTIPFKLGGENLAIRAVGIGGIFNAKLKMGRDKDLNDYLRFIPTEGRKLNAQDGAKAPMDGWKAGPTAKAQGTPSTDAEVAQAKAYFAKVLDPKFKAEFLELTGHSGEFIEAQNLIQVSLSAAAGIMQTATHEAFHAFFSQYAKGNPAVIDTMKALAEDPKILARLEALLHKYPAAVAQLSDGEERMAYVYQFWAAGKLDIGPGKPRNWLQKLSKFFRGVLGTLRDDERAVALLEAFHSGGLKDPSEGAKAVAAIVTPDSWPIKARRNFDGLIQKAGQLAMPAQSIMETSESPSARRLGRMFYAEPGKEDAGRTGEGMINAKRTEVNRRKNALMAAMEGLTERDLEAVTKHMQRNSHSADIAYKPVRDAVASLRGQMEDFHKYMTDSGLQIGRIPDYFPVVWDSDKLAANRDEFVDMLMTHYEGQMMAAAASSEGGMTALEAANRLATVIIDRKVFDGKIAPQRKDGVLVPFFESGNERTLDWIKPEHRAPFLDKNLVSTMTKYFSQGVRAAEYTRRFGEDGKMLDIAISRIEQELDKASAAKLKNGQFKTAADAQKWAVRQMRDVRTAVGAMEGTLGKDITDTRRKINSYITVYQNVRLLPLALFASVVDPLAIAARSGNFKVAGEAFMLGMKEVIKSWKQEITGLKSEHQQTAWEKLAEKIGATESEIFAGFMSDAYSSDYMSPRAKKINDAMFKYNGMETWNRSMRIAATKAGSEFIVEHATKPGPHSRRWLKELGLSAGDVHVDSAGVIVVDASSLAKVGGMDIAKAEKQSRKLMFAMNRFVEGGVLTPNSAQRPGWASDPNVSFLFHLKQFTYSFHQTVLGRAWNEMKHDNLAPMGALAWFIPSMIAADMTKGLMLNGGELPSYMKGWDAGDWLLHGAERGAVFGYGQIGVDGMQDPFSVFGPMVEQVTDAIANPIGDTVIRAMPAHALYKNAVM